MRHFCRFSFLQRVYLHSVDVTKRNSLQCIGCIRLTIPANYLSCGTTHHNLPTTSQAQSDPQRQNSLLKVYDPRVFQVRFKKRKPQKNRVESELETEEESDAEHEEEVEEEDEVESELDYDAPLVHKDMVIYSLRADSVVAKGLKMSKHDAEALFYSSKFLLNGQKLLKKGTKLKPGDIIDVVTEKTMQKLFVKRVKVLKVEGKSAKGNDVVHIRMWRDPFEIDRPSDYHDSEDGA